ncbi:MAG: HAD hydrolase-like protein [Planctomycetaceae bacterium]|jgi:phosphoglycolate phosphatase-like HAD superfamily hydrolase|nr:HAD hydrolase-like protein [Planctomycetaceae bacterium]
MNLKQKNMTNKKDNIFSKTFLIGIDSDGCAFDTMELKHKECFVPATIKYWNLQAVSKYARETFEFVNLYSKTRGINRFPALVETLRLLFNRPEVKARGLVKPDLTALNDWISRETKLGNPALIKEEERSHNPIIKQTLEWSLAINAAVDEIVGEGVPPFPFVKESLQKMQTQADVIVVSATPQEALEREWKNQNIDKYVAAIYGQEAGTKRESLAKSIKTGNFNPNNVLMIGDAPGDLKAAQAVNALFFPINPGAEEESWRQLFNEGIDNFFNNAFAGEYQTQLINKFNSYLPTIPSWEKYN